MRGGGDPVHHQVVEQLVLGERPLDVAVAVGPGAELLDDPRRQPGGGVVERVPHRLGLGRLLLHVAGVHRVVRAHAVEEPLLLEGDVLGHRDRGRHVEVDARAVLGVGERDLARHEVAPVAALRDVAVVAEPRHELGPRPCDAARVPAALDGGSGEPVAGEARHHHVERVGGIAAVRSRVAERLDHVEELDERTRPPVGEQQRERALDRRRGVEEVHAGAVDLGAEVVERVHARLPGGPVVVLGPVRDQLAQVLELGAVVPARAGDLGREAGRPQARPEVLEDGVVDVDPERFDGEVPTHVGERVLRPARPGCASDVTATGRCGTSGRWIRPCVIIDR